MLNFLEFGSEGRTLLLLHGLFGSSTNWRRIARELSTDYRVIGVDLRNHGKSPHYPSMTYRDMSRDLVNLAKQLELDTVAVCGHSMGGKAAMLLALQHPDLVSRLVVLDVAPVTYGHSFLPLIDAMSALDLSSLASRAEADRQLQASISDSPTRLFLLQNLVHRNGQYEWRLNLPVLKGFMSELTGFPADVVAGQSYPGETIFIHGEQSDYVVPAYHDPILRYFPCAQVSELPGAGHWLHTDQPGQLLARIRAFLS